MRFVPIVRVPCFNMVYCYAGALLEKWLTDCDAPQVMNALLLSRCLVGEMFGGRDRKAR